MLEEDSQNSFSEERSGAVVMSTGVVRLVNVASTSVDVTTLSPLSQPYSALMT